MTVNQGGLPPTNDNSNPQQGNKYNTYPKKEEAHIAGNGQVTQNDVARKYVKVPPTKKDLRKLFVGGVASSVTDDDFLAFFQQFGAVVDSVVIFDKETRRSRGFGFVTFEEPSVAQTVLKKSRSEPRLFKIKGKVCELKPAEPKLSMSNNRSEQGRAPIPKAGFGESVIEAVIPTHHSVPRTQYYNRFHDTLNVNVAGPWLHPPQFAPSYHADYHGFYATHEYNLSHNHHFDAYAQAQVGPCYPAGFSHGPHGVPFPDALPDITANKQFYGQSPACAHGTAVPYSGMHPAPAPFLPMAGAVPNMDIPPAVFGKEFAEVENKENE